MELELIKRSPKGKAKARPLLFVHGAWHGAWCWDEHFLGYFAERGWESYALSLRGHGQSSGATFLARINHYVKDVKSVIAGLPARPVLVGHSMGGLVLRRYIEKNDPPAAVLLAPLPTCGTLPLSARILLSHPARFLLTILTMDLTRVVRPRKICREMFFSDTLDDALLSKYFRLLGGESFMAYLEMSVSLGHPRRVGFPMLLLGAEKDSIFTVEEMEKTAAAYGAEHKIFKGMAHDMMLEPGWEEVAAYMSDWLDKRI